MAKTVIKTSTPHRFGITMTICGHSVPFDEEGMCEIDSEIANELIEKDASISAADPKEVKEEPTIKLAEGEIEIIDDGINIGDEIDLKDLTKKGLQDVASEAGLDKSQWAKLNKAKLIEYLDKHL